MYLQYVEVEVKPEKIETFLAYSRAFLGAIARQPGGVWFRILRFTQNPLLFASVRVWRSQAEAEAVWQAPYMRFMEGLAGQLDLQAGHPRGGIQQMELVDLAWGLRGAAAFPGEGRFVHLVTGRLMPEKYPLWRVSSRNIMATVARQPGIAAFEHFRPLNEPTGFLVIRSFLSERDEPSTGLGSSEEMKWALEPTARLKLYEGAPTPAVRKAYVHDMVWGAAGTVASQEFIERGQPYVP